MHLCTRVWVLLKEQAELACYRAERLKGNASAGVAACAGLRWSMNASIQARVEWALILTAHAVHCTALHCTALHCTAHTAPLCTATHCSLSPAVYGIDRSFTAAHAAPVAPLLERPIHMRRDRRRLRRTRVAPLMHSGDRVQSTGNHTLQGSDTAAAIPFHGTAHRLAVLLRWATGRARRQTFATALSRCRQ